MRILVCGSRTWAYADVVGFFLDGLLARHGELTVIEGGATGADAKAAAWAKARQGHVGWLQFEADWEHCGSDCPKRRHRRTRRDGSDYCPLAGHRRNQRMLNEARPEGVLAFVDKPLENSRGTADMVRRAHKADIPVFVVERRSPRSVADVTIHGPIIQQQQQGYSSQALQDAFDAGRRSR